MDKVTLITDKGNFTVPMDALFKEKSTEDPRELLIKDIVAWEHHGNEKIVETKEFTDGIRCCLKYLGEKRIL